MGPAFVSLTVPAILKTCLMEICWASTKRLLNVNWTSSLGLMNIQCISIVDVHLTSSGHHKWISVTDIHWTSIGRPHTDIGNLQ